MSGGGVDLRLWGKSRGLPGAYPLVCHLLDTAAVAGALWDGYLSGGFRRYIARQLGVGEDHARSLVMLWAGLHDIGKAMACFQGQERERRPPADLYPDSGNERIPHDLATHRWLIMRLAELGYPRGKVCAFVAQALGGHHGVFHPIGQPDADPVAVLPELGGGAWETQRLALLKTVHEIVGAPAPPEKVRRPGAALVCGVVILADWLASQDRYLEERLPDIPASGDPDALAKFFQHSVALAPSLVERARLRRLRLREGSFVEEFGFAANGMQASVEADLPALVDERGGLLLVTVPTGEGKTEAALHAARVLGTASGATGVFFGLPTMATADGMYARAGSFVERRAEGPAGVTLLHSMAWLNAAYHPVADDSTVISYEHEAGSSRRTDPGEWLRGAKRGLLAQMAIGTIDQALLSVLPVRHNMLRMLGLAGKVFVVDEVHAYDAYMQGLLRRLLTWLGQLGVPVVLLSATLPRQVSRRLIESYLAGAARPTNTADVPDVPYPGWLYVDAATGDATAREVVTEPRRLRTEVREVPRDALGGLDRSAALRELLAPAVDEAGCVAVIVNTVAEAQRTFRDLKAWFGAISAAGGEAPDLDLLHARFPADQRERITADIIAKYGKNGHRPRHGGVVVATQVIEQSLDLDFDLMISDLAPVALLLQRAGRCHRHANDRPASLSGPRLVVLTYPDAEPPAAWPYVYPVSLLRRTRELLAVWGEQHMAIPGDVQAVVDQVYDESFADGEMQSDDIERIAADQVMRSVAEKIGIPVPATLTDLRQLTDRELDEDLIATRLGADSARVLCVYDTADGRRCLDPGCAVPLPEPNRKGRFTPDQVRQVMAQTIPVPSTWVADRTADNEIPAEWQDNPFLRRLVLLPHPVRADGPEPAARIGSKLLRLHPEEGLIRS